MREDPISREELDSCAEAIVEARALADEAASRVSLAKGSEAKREAKEIHSMLRRLAGDVEDLYEDLLKYSDYPTSQRHLVNRIQAALQRARNAAAREGVTRPRRR